MAKPASLELPILDHDLLDKVSNGRHHDPHSVLGVHSVVDEKGAQTGWVIRTLRPLAKKVGVELGKTTLELEHLDNGVWQGFVALKDAKTAPDYRVLATYVGAEGDTEWRADDSYHHLPTLTEFDLHLIGEGRHEELWKALGSHLHSVKGDLGESYGTRFAVWAPNAQAVRVVGEFNHWNGIAHSMRVMGSTGVWEVFIQIGRAHV